MPLIQRTIEPVNLSRGQVSANISNELECVTNNTLSNIIRQLSSLSKHAEDMFGELFKEANTFFDRANNLQSRVEALKVKVTRLDSTVEEVSLKDIDMRKPFKSSVIKDSQVISPRTIPQAMKETYIQCDAPPPLSKLNVYREDGKDSMKFYTDTTYFFELWCREIQKDTEQQKKELRRRKRKPKQPHREDQHKIRPVRDHKEKYRDMAKGKEFMTEARNKAIQEEPDEKTPSRPNSLELGHMQIPTNQEQAMMQSGRASNDTPMMQQRGYANNHPEHPNGHAVGAYDNRNLGQQQMYQQQMLQQQQHQQQQHQQNMSQYNSPQAAAAMATASPYNHNHNLAMMMISDQGPPSSPHHGVDPAGPYGQSPMRNGPVHAGRVPSAMMNSPSSRPSAPPPAPPAGIMARNSPTKSLHASRESLPPPPPPPDPGYQQQEDNATRVARMQQQQQRESPMRQNMMHHHHSPSPPGAKTPESMDLPPPPPPPMHPGTPESIGSMSPPPPAPPPLSTIPAPPPPPPMNIANLSISADNPTSATTNHLAPPDGVSISSNSSGQTSTSASTNKSDEKEKEAEEKDEDRSDLLLAIRKGIQLRKVEKKEEKNNKPQGGLDVQSIMEAAFELRRKALEANDSDSQDSDSDQGWDSDDQ